MTTKQKLAKLRKLYPDVAFQTPKAASHFLWSEASIAEYEGNMRKATFLRECAGAESSICRALAKGEQP